MHFAHKQYKRLPKPEDSMGLPRRVALRVLRDYRHIQPTHLVVCVGAGRVGRLPQHQQRGLVAEPHDELARRVRPCADRHHTDTEHSLYRQADAHKRLLTQPHKQLHLTL